MAEQDNLFKSFGFSCSWNLGTGNGRIFVLEDYLEQPSKLHYHGGCSAVLIAERGSHLAVYLGLGLCVLGLFLELFLATLNAWYLV